MKKLFIALSILCTSVSLADVRTAEWSAPVLRTDESSLPLSEIRGYRLHVRTETGLDVQIIEVGRDRTEYELNLFPGIYVVSIATVDMYGMTSESSNSITVQIELPANPIAPSQFKLQ